MGVRPFNAHFQLTTTNMNEKPKKPDWKQSKCDHDKQSLAKFRESPISDTMPNASFRLAYLDDRDAQLTRLLDYAQNMGIPMGSATWATRMLSRIKHLEDIHRATMRLLRSPKGKPLEDIQRLVDDVAHARKMLIKAKPETQVMCDSCGWPGARPIGDGWVACNDCLPEGKNSAQ